MTQTQVHPARHYNDPCTSTDAAAAHREQAETNMRRVCDAVVRFPSRTAGELAGLLDMELIEVRRRLSDAKKMGLVINGEARPCRVRGNRASVWRAVR